MDSYKCDKCGNKFKTFPGLARHHCKAENDED